MNVCIVGLGRMGRRHVEAARRAGLRIVGGFDILPDSVEVAVREGVISRDSIYQSLDSMISHVRPDAIVIASTAPSHSAYVCQAAKAGIRFILCEKPMAVSIAECDLMIDVCRRHGAILAVNHQMRFMEQYTVVKEMAESAVFGGLRSITVAASNFGLAMNGVHYFEMFRYLTGEDLESVIFYADDTLVPNPRGIEFKDHSGQLFARSNSGRRLIIEFGGDLGHGVQVVYGCHYGQIIVDELGGGLRAISREQQYSNLPTTRYGMPAKLELRQIAPVDVIDSTSDVWRSILRKGEFPDGMCGRHAVRALVAAHESMRRGALLVNLNEQLPAEQIFSWA